MFLKSEFTPKQKLYFIKFISNRFFMVLFAYGKTYDTKIDINLFETLRRKIKKNEIAVRRFLLESTIIYSVQFKTNSVRTCLGEVNENKKKKKNRRM